VHEKLEKGGFSSESSRIGPESFESKDPQIGMTKKLKFFASFDGGFRLSYVIFTFSMRAKLATLLNLFTGLSINPGSRISERECDLNSPCVNIANKLCSLCYASTMLS
jgi:hypothetical protein